MSGFSHFDEQGTSRMVNVGDKPITRRLARAEGQVRASAATISAILDRTIAKGDVFEVARLAGIMGAKKTSELIPLCHPLSLESIDIRIEPSDERTLKITATVAASDRTGVEMEAMTAVAITSLTIYDMCKSLDREIRIGPIELIEKQGGKSGHFARRPNSNSSTDLTE